MTRQHLLDAVWSYQHYGDTRTLDVHIRRLRQSLGVCGPRIETVIGVGYRFAPCEPREDISGVTRLESEISESAIT